MSCFDGCSYDPRISLLVNGCVTTIAGAQASPRHTRIRFFERFSVRRAKIPIVMPASVQDGALILFRMMRNAAVPPFWTYASFIVMNLMALVAFAALTIDAIRMRKETQWHRRLMFCGMRDGPGSLKRRRPRRCRLCGGSRHMTPQRPTHKKFAIAAARRPRQRHKNVALRAGR